MKTTGDILGFWKNNMDAEEKKLYENLKESFAKIGMPWKENFELDFATIPNAIDRKEIMSDYLKRLQKRLASPVCPRPENYSN